MLSRRVFLKNGAFAFVSLGFAPSFMARTAVAASGRSKQLIAIFQRGAVDGLNVVVPHGENDYYRARPNIAIPRPNGGDAAAIDLDGFFGFNPKLQPLKPLWDRHELAIVHACGSPDSTRSHFDAQDYMETATPGVKSTADGWLNRYLQARRDETPARTPGWLTVPRLTHAALMVLAAQGVAVGLDPHHEAELAGPRAEGQEVGVGERLAPRQGEVHHLQPQQPGQQAEVVVAGERRPPRRQVVVAEEAVEVAAVGQLAEQRIRAWSGHEVRYPRRVRRSMRSSTSRSRSARGTA